jgi:hypothetical protein
MTGDRDRLYLDEEIVELLEKAARMGMDLGKGSDLEYYSISELERLVNQVQ